MKARIKLNQNLFEINEQENTISVIEEGNKTFLNLKLEMNAFEIKEETDDEVMNDFIKHNYRDKAIKDELLGDSGHENGIIEFTKTDPTKNERSTLLTIIVELDPKIPYTSGT